MVRKLVAVARQQLLSSLRYRGSLLTQLVTVFAELAGFYFLAKAIGPQFRPEGMDYFAFVLVGTAYYGFLVSSISIFVGSVREIQLTGTMEVLMTTSTPPVMVICLQAFAQFAIRTLQMLAYLAVGVVMFGYTSFQPNLAAFLLVLVPAIVLAVAIGLIAAALQVWIQRGNMVVWLLASLGWLLTGTMFPVGTLPTMLHPLAEAIPITALLSAMRETLVSGVNANALLGELARLGAWVAVLFPASLFALKHALRTARRHGTLSWY